MMKLNTSISSHLRPKSSSDSRNKGDNKPPHFTLLCHLKACGATLGVIALGLTLSISCAMLIPTVSTPHSAVAETEVGIHFIDNPDTTESLTPAAESAANESTARSSAKSASKLEGGDDGWLTIDVQEGDNLTTLLKRAALGPADVDRLMSSSSLTKVLTNMRPGQQIKLDLTDDGLLQQLSYTKSKIESYLFKATSSDRKAAFKAIKIVREPKIVKAFRQVTIDNSLSEDGEKAQIPPSLVLKMAKTFGWKKNFPSKLRKGDHFSLVYEEKYVDDQLVGTGNILAARFIKQGRTFEAVRYTRKNGKSAYYTPSGEELHKTMAMRRSPVNFQRISSNFNMYRRHPITGIVRPHRGTDYVAPRGTPVYAAGDGKVVKSTYSRVNGHFVVIKHAKGYTTKYLHLHNRKVKKGQRVKMGQRIGAVGSTGRATGVHLHYEVLVHGVHKNPRKVKLPSSMALAKNERWAFKKATRPLLKVLDSNPVSSIASREDNRPQKSQVN